MNISDTSIKFLFIDLLSNFNISVEDASMYQCATSSAKGATEGCSEESDGSETCYCGTNLCNGQVRLGLSWSLLILSLAYVINT